MISFDRFQLDNGLRVVVHRDTSSPIAALNLVYDVGAKDEDSDRTGFAHLFEHLMFGGSVNIPSYDEPLQRVGGENNASTSNDLTNYYLTLPLSNIETGFWLESDRMLSLAFTEKSLEVQRQVVIEEFRQRYLNQPYGDVWMLLRPLVYKKHPYRWPTIGKEVAHIERATLDEVKDFFAKHYSPQNAVLAVAGDIDTEEVRSLAEKWFGPIPAGNKYVRDLPVEPEQTEMRRLQVEREVPQDALYMAWRMPKRNDPAYYVADLTTDILSRGASSRLLNRLVKQQQLFTELSSYITGEIETGLLLVSGKLAPGVTAEQGEAAIRKEIDLLKSELVGEKELQKVKNKSESSRLFSEINVLNKAMQLAWHELMGDANRVNTEQDKYDAITADSIRDFCSKYLVDEGLSVLDYRSKNGS